MQIPGLSSVGLQSALRIDFYFKHTVCTEAYNPQLCPKRQSSTYLISLSISKPLSGFASFPLHSVSADDFV